jgi:SAM-dependent methyltransferase
MVDGKRQRLRSATRRFFDLQASSIWRDLKALLDDVHGVVVDAGCGAQPYRSLLPNGSSYIGIDIDRADFGYSTSGVLRITPGGRWPVADCQADVVLVTEVLEHVRDPSQFLAEAYRCARPRGTIILTVPFAARWHYVPHDYWRFTPSGLGLLFERAGFIEVAVHARGDERTVALYKLLGLVLPVALPQEGSIGRARLAKRVLAAPVIVCLAGLAKLTMSRAAGEDCLGYTVCAVRPALASSAED